MKKCIACYEEKSTDQFYTLQKRGKPYTQPRCKDCHQLYCKDWYAKNTEKHNLASTNWRKNNPERWSEIKQKCDGAYYHKAKSELADRAVKLFNRMSEKQRTRFASQILFASMVSRGWAKACRVYDLDEWLGAYSGV